MSDCTQNRDYLEFLQGKFRFSKSCGFDVADGDITPMAKPHQRDCIKWAIGKGRAALFESFGLGKSLQQLEILRLIGEREGGRQLIVAPLGVRQEFKRDADMLGIDGLQFVRRTEEAGGEGLYITNYESVRDGRLDVNLFNAVSLDEASVLRSFGSDTYQSFLTLFQSTKYRFVATATPSPNRYKELIHYAGFLGVMDTGQALTRFFQRDSSKANNLTLYPHKEREFYVWLHSWAIFLQKPSDLGYSDDGYSLPGLAVHYHEISARELGGNINRDGQVNMFKDAALSLKDAATEKRESIDDRVAKMMEIIRDDPGSHYLLWHDLESERHAIKKVLPEAVEVFGSLDLDERERRVVDFSEGRIRYLATKPELSGSGCNFQRHCHKMIFLGIGYKFNDFIQSIHRCHRFLQDQEVEVHIIHTETEREVLSALQTKWRQHEDVTGRMSEIIREHGLSTAGMELELARTIGVERQEVRSREPELWLAANNDCVLETRSMEENSVGLIVTSIPFANHYEYTPSYNDFGHTEDNDHFWAQMDFLAPELLRILQPGRLYCCHVKDRILFGNVTGAGAPTVSPFHCEAIMHYIRHGFDYMGMITVVTDVVRENNQTYRLGWTEQCKDGTKMGVGSPEYVLLFRKPQTDRTRGYADVPVVKSKEDYTRARWQVDAHAFWRSGGNRFLSASELEGLGPDALAKAFTEASLNGIYDHAEHVAVGEALEQDGRLPATFMAIAPGSHDDAVWHDVNRMRTLNGEQARRNVQMHVCLARDSLVLTKRGFVPIQDVQVGDMTLTHMGRWRKVEVVRNTGVRMVVNLRAQGVAALSLTPEHKVWARKSDWTRERDGAKRAEPSWIRADESVNGYVNLKLPPVEDSVLSEPDLWLIGRWLADGHVGTRDDFHISIGPEKLPEFETKAMGFIGSRRRNTAVQIRLKGLHAELAAALRKCGSGAEGKQVPAELLALPAHKARALLDGYLSGDGHLVAGRGTWQAASVSRALLLGMAMLAQRAYGAVAGMHPGRSPGSKIIEGRTVRTRQEWYLSFDLPAKNRRMTPFVMDDGSWKKVRSADQIGEVETWCLRVEEDASFTAEGCIVANCPLQLDIVDRLINRYSNKGDLVFDPFGGLHTVPYCAVKSGRRGRGVELNTGYWRDGVRYLQSVEAEATMPTLFDFLDGEQAA